MEKHTGSNLNTNEQQNSRKKSFPENTQDGSVPESKHVINLPESKHVINLPESKHVINLPESKQVINLPENKQDKHFPENKQDKYFPESAQYKNLPESAQYKNLPQNNHDKNTQHDLNTRDTTQLPFPPNHHATGGNRIVLPPLNKKFISEYAPEMSQAQSFSYPMGLKRMGMLPLSAPNMQMAYSSRPETLTANNINDFMPKLTSPEQYLSQINQRNLSQINEQNLRQTLTAQHTYPYSTFSGDQTYTASAGRLVQPNRNTTNHPPVQSHMGDYKTAFSQPGLSSTQNYFSSSSSAAADLSIHFQSNPHKTSFKNSPAMQPSFTAQQPSFTAQQPSFTTQQSLALGKPVPSEKGKLVERSTKRRPLSSEKLVHINCPICNKVFNRQSSYQNHKNTHTGARPYMCKVCGKTFNASPNLSRHKKIHEKEKQSRS